MSRDKCYTKQKNCLNITSVCNHGLNLWVAKLKYVFEIHYVLLCHFSGWGDLFLKQN